MGHRTRRQRPQPHRADATAAAFESLIQAIETFCSREAIDLCFFKDLHRDFAHRELWRARGYREMHSLPTVKLNTAFPDMNAYIASLSSNGRSHARSAAMASSSQSTSRRANPRSAL